MADETKTTPEAPVTTAAPAAVPADILEASPETAIAAAPEGADAGVQETAPIEAGNGPTVADIEAARDAAVQQVSVLQAQLDDANSQLAERSALPLATLARIGELEASVKTKDELLATAEASIRALTPSLETEVIENSEFAVWVSKEAADALRRACDEYRYTIHASGIDGDHLVAVIAQIDAQFKA